MDKPNHQNIFGYFTQCVRLLSLSYIVCFSEANAAAGFTTIVSSDDNFYRPSLYRENYILPYHYSKRKMRPRPTTLSRTLPIFQKKMRSRHGTAPLTSAESEKSINTEKTPAEIGHRRNLSSMNSEKRRGMIIEETQNILPTAEDTISPTQYLTPISPIQYKDAFIQRTKTVIRRRERAMEQLEGKPGSTQNDRGKQEVEKEIEEELTDAFEELFDELLQLLKFDFISDTEVAFQISLKIPLWRLERTDTRFYAAYTQQSWWQCYTGVSAFFRESNYLPECFIEQPFRITSTKTPQVENLKVGLVHQSNGAGIFLERSWNRLFAEIRFRWGLWSLLFEPWCVLPTKDLPVYNPNIAQELGYWRAKLQFEHALFRCAFQTQKNSYQFLGHVPLSRSLNCTFYYFNGKGLSLGLQDQYNSAWGIGIGARL